MTRAGWRRGVAAILGGVSAVHVVAAVASEVSPTQDLFESACVAHLLKPSAVAAWAADAGLAELAPAELQARLPGLAARAWRSADAGGELALVLNDAGFCSVEALEADPIAVARDFTAFLARITAARTLDIHLVRDETAALGPNGACRTQEFQGPLDRRSYGLVFLMTTCPSPTARFHAEIGGMYGRIE